MNILLTTPQGANLERYFPSHLRDRLSALGRLTLNDTPSQLPRERLRTLLADTDAVLTHWGSPRLDADLLDAAPRLKILAHCAGSVAQVASEACYDRGIHVLSANPVMAKYVAECTLGCMIAGLREFTALDKETRSGGWVQNIARSRSLFGAAIGLVGLGTVGRCLLDLLAPFGCRVVVCDPYLPENALARWDFARPGSFAEAMEQPIVSIHASQTPETFHLVDADALARMPEDGLLINTARGSLVDTAALIPEVTSGRLRAVLDVYEGEGLPQDPRLLHAGSNLLLLPHTAALPAGSAMTAAIIDDLERYAQGFPLRLSVSRSQYLRMTRE